MKSRMFPFVTKTWNPVVGCRHGCIYCWARKLAETKLKGTKRYKTGFLPMLWPEELDKFFSARDCVFVSDMGDLFGKWVPYEWINSVVDRISTMDADFLLLTKNPIRYLDFPAFISDNCIDNCILGCTIESDRNYPQLSKAPPQSSRLYWMTKLAEVMEVKKNCSKLHSKLFVCIEPILDFDLDDFSNVIANSIKPWAVAIGYDNYDNHLPEPPLAKTMQLIDRLEKAGITVYRKTLRERWAELTKGLR